MMSSDGPTQRRVKALFNYKGKYNDELCFNKDDIVTVTQVVDGGWWEGTLGDKTGWFPSNYVKDLVQTEHRPTVTQVVTTNVPNGDLSLNKRDSMLFYRNIVVAGLLESERVFVSHLSTLISTYLKPLQNNEILKPSEYNHLVGNLEEVTALHKQFLASLESIANLPVPNQSVGATFMEYVPQVKILHTRYCANHPYAVNVLQNKRTELDSFMSSIEAPNNSAVMNLTTSLSSPFTRLQKYPGVLKELDRHSYEGHSDRGNTQRAMSLYQDTIASCQEARKLKETELTILYSTIKDWHGDGIDTLGDVLIMCSVKICTTADSSDQILMIFTSMFVLLTVSPTLSSYTLTCKHSLNGVTVTSIEDSKHSHCFQLAGSLKERIIMSCATSIDKLRCMEIIRHQTSYSTNKPQNLQISTSQPSMSTLSKAPISHQPVVLQPPNPSTSATTCLRPSPPMRPAFVKDDACKQGKFNTIGRRKPVERARSEDDVLSYYGKIDDSKTLEEDAMILKVIEAYCTSAKTRHTVNSLDLRKIRHTQEGKVSKFQFKDSAAVLDSPQLLIAEEEKLIVEEIRNNHVVVQEKSLVDTVYSLRDQIQDIALEQKRLRRDLEEEIQARSILDNMMARKLMAK